MDQEQEPGQLFSAIEERAGEERARIHEEAETRARVTLEEAEAEIQRLKAEALRGLEREMASEAQRLVGDARMKTRGEGLQVKRRLLAEAFARARTEVERLCASPNAAAALEILSAEASAAVGEPCSVEVDVKKGSVVAVSSDGRRRADNSLLSRLNRAQAAFEAEVAGLLFGRAPG
ncbi:MAG: V-type ATP synthase subunit E [Spirochaetia bacterium]